jgi:hypothetical protein
VGWLERKKEGIGWGGWKKGEKRLAGKKKGFICVLLLI